MTKNSQTTTYEYDEKGLRVRKITPTGETRYIDKYTEITPNGVVRHIYANDKLIASIDEFGTLTFNFQDHLGSSNLRTDNTGNVLQRKEYLPFGGTRLETGSYQAINYGFTNQYEDKESGLYYYKQRYYNPELGRFLTADPLYAEEMNSRGTGSQELNLYAYVRNNPLAYIDPHGLDVYFISLSSLGIFSNTQKNNENIVETSVSRDIGLAFDTTSKKLDIFTTKGSGTESAGYFVGLGVTAGKVDGSFADFYGEGLETSANAGVGVDSAGLSKIETSTGKEGYSFDIYGPGIGAGGSVRKTETTPIIQDILFMFDFRSGSSDEGTQNDSQGSSE